MPYCRQKGVHKPSGSRDLLCNIVPWINNCVYCPLRSSQYPRASALGVKISLGPTAPYQTQLPKCKTFRAPLFALLPSSWRHFSTLCVTGTGLQLLKTCGGQDSSFMGNCIGPSLGQGRPVSREQRKVKIGHLRICKKSPTARLHCQYTRHLQRGCALMACCTTSPP